MSRGFSSQIIGIILRLALVEQSKAEEHIFKPIYEMQESWEGGFKGEIHAPVEWGQNITSWIVEVTFVGVKLNGFDCWGANIAEQSINVGKNETEFKLINTESNGVIPEGKTTDIGFIAKLLGKDLPPKAIVKFNGKLIHNELDTSFYYVRETKPMEIITSSDTNSTTVIIEGENDDFSDLRDDLVEDEDEDETEDKTEDSSCDDDDPSCNMAIPTVTPDEEISKMKYNYKDVVSKSILFYMAQRSGKLPENFKIQWRKDSALFDKGRWNESDVDLTGGYYDAGDNIKLGYPLAFSLTSLSWGLLHYWDSYIAMGQIDEMLDLIKWGVEWLLKAVVISKEKVQIVYVQVDDKKSHSKWNKPEEIKQGWPRPSYFINRQKPGTDLCSEYVAALSAAHLCFKRAKQQELFTEEGAGEFVTKLKSVSLKLWEFSEMAKVKNQGALEGVKYSDSVPEAGEMYPSSHYQDERCWALLWLYRATGDRKFYDSARKIFIFRKFNFMQQSKHMFSWDDKILGIQLLIAQVTRENVRRDYINPLLKYCRVKDKAMTPGGLWWVSKWAPNRYAANSAFLCLMASEYDQSNTDAKDFATSQVHYFLGENPKKMSYVVGFGDLYPQRPHHRGASCPQTQMTCGDQFRDSGNPNPNILFGALVGGPDDKDEYKDDRNDYEQSEVALDYNACFQGLVAGMFHHEIIQKKRVYIYSSIAEDKLLKNHKILSKDTLVPISSSTFNFLSIFLLMYSLLL